MTSVCSLTAKILHKHFVTISFSDDNSNGGCFILAMHFQSNTATLRGSCRLRGLERPMSRNAPLLRLVKKRILTTVNVHAIVMQTPCIAKLCHPPLWGCGWVAAHAHLTIHFKHVSLVICAIKDNKSNLLITQGI